jgi:diguanylate cyclase (GGDEF)-like protein/PAS domain S-box-containing protein
MSTMGEEPRVIMQGDEGFPGASEGDLSEAEDPVTKYILRSIRGGIITSAFVLLVLFLYALLPGTGLDNRNACLVLIGVGAVLTVISAFLPWAKIVGSKNDKALIFGWAFGLIALVDIGIALTGSAHSELFIVLVIVMVFMGGPYYSLRAEITMNAIAIASYVITLAATGWGINAATLAFRLGMMAAAALAVGTLSHELMTGLHRAAGERLASERRVVLWSKVASLVRQIDSPETTRVLEAVVDAVGTLGFDAAAISELQEDGASLRVLHARHLAHPFTVKTRDGKPEAVVPAVLERRTTVVIENYPSLPGAIQVAIEAGLQTVVAAPVWVSGQIVAVLQGGSKQARIPASDQIAAFEMFATQAGRALENAQLLERRRREADHFRQLLASAPDAVIVIGRDGRIVEASNQAELLYGYSTDELVGQSVTLLMPERIKHVQTALLNDWVANTGNPKLGPDPTVFGRKKDGTEIPLELAFSTIETPEGELTSVAIRDVSERREFERRLTHQATHDALTGLPNRELFSQRLIASLRGRLGIDPPVTVCFLDLDHFKYVNDSRGHRTGDALVEAVAERLVGAVDNHFIARVGGDEFGVLVEGLADQQAAANFAGRLLSVFDEPFLVDAVDCYITASVGLAFARTPDQSGMVMRNADAAMYRAKRNGRARAAFFDETLTALAAERVATEASLHLALAGNQFELVYQPIIALDDGHMTGVEALLRWHHPEKGLVLPDQFMSTAEDTGLVVPVGRWALEEACRQIATWRSRFPQAPDLTVSVNVSGRQLEHDHFVTDVENVLRDSRIPPALLILEITESFFIRDFQAAVGRLTALKRLGVRLAIDDFGTGFSTLFSLSRLPVDTVKIDKAFIDGLGTRYDAVVSAVVTMGNAFDLQVVAEGIEHRSQRDRLIELGCRFAQGFYFSMPLTTPDVEVVLERMSKSPLSVR